MHDMMSNYQYTILVPSDAAWSKISKPQQDMLFKSRARLRDVMLMHYIRGSPMLYSALRAQKTSTQVRNGNMCSRFAMCRSVLVILNADTQIAH